MQLFASTAAFLALISSVFAQTEGFDAITSPTEGQILQAGQTYTITWDPTAEYNSDTVTIRLLQGADQNTLDFNPNNVVGMQIPVPISEGSTLLTGPNSKHQQLAWFLLLDG